MVSEIDNFDDLLDYVQGIIDENAHLPATKGTELRQMSIIKGALIRIQHKLESK